MFGIHSIRFKDADKVAATASAAVAPAVTPVNVVAPADAGSGVSAAGGDKSAMAPAARRRIDAPVGDGILQRMAGRRLTRRRASWPLWLVAGIGMCLTACQSPEERCLNTIREAVYADDFSKGLATADAFYRKHAVEKTHPTEESMALRWEISAYVRLCLLMTGELNNRFLAYYPVQELGVLFPEPLPFVNRHCYAYARLYYEMGLYGPALPVVLWHAEDQGWTQADVNLLFGIYTHTRQGRAAQTYWQAFQQDGKTRRWSRPWADTVARMAVGYRAVPDGNYTEGTWPRPLSTVFLAGPRPDEMFIDGYAKAVFRQAVDATGARAAIMETAAAETPGIAIDTGAADATDTAYATIPNRYLTDYCTLLYLLEKDLAQVPRLLDMYLRQGRPIPDYLQEATLILATDADAAAALEAAGLTRGRLNLTTAMEQRVAKVFQDFEMLKIGALPFDEMTRRHAATYTYHFLFGQIQ